MTFQAEILASLGWTWNDGAVDNRRLDCVARLPGGNGDNQAQAVWHAENQLLLSGAAVTLDLAALTRTILGDLNTVAMVAVKALLVVNHNQDGGSLVLGGAETDEWSAPFGAAGDQVLVPRASPMLLAHCQTGWDVDAAHRNLRLAASGGDVSYSIAIVGTTTRAGSGSGSGQ